MSRRSKGGWYDRVPRRISFEHQARQVYPGLGGVPDRRSRPVEIVYSLKVEVPGYDSRKVVIRFLNGSQIREPRITVDGPDRSPHRYKGGALCIWEPKDDQERRWVAKDGLLALIDHIRQHLFREAWWREHGEWLGEEVVHWSGDEAKEAA